MNKRQGGDLVYFTFQIQLGTAVIKIDYLEDPICAFTN